MSEPIYMSQVRGRHLTDDEVCDLIEGAIKKKLLDPDKLRIGQKVPLNQLDYLMNVVN